MNEIITIDNPISGSIYMVNQFVDEAIKPNITALQQTNSYTIEIEEIIDKQAFSGIFFTVNYSLSQVTFKVSNKIIIKNNVVSQQKSNSKTFFIPGIKFTNLAINSSKNENIKLSIKPSMTYIPAYVIADKSGKADLAKHLYANHTSSLDKDNLFLMKLTGGGQTNNNFLIPTPSVFIPYFGYSSHKSSNNKINIGNTYYTTIGNVKEKFSINHQFTNNTDKPCVFMSFTENDARKIDKEIKTSFYPWSKKYGISIKINSLKNFSPLILIALPKSLKKKYIKETGYDEHRHYYNNRYYSNMILD